MTTLHLHYLVMHSSHNIKVKLYKNKNVLKCIVTTIEANRKGCDKCAHVFPQLFLFTSTGKPTCVGALSMVRKSTQAWQSTREAPRQKPILDVHDTYRSIITKHLNCHICNDAYDRGMSISITDILHNHHICIISNTATT